MTGSLCACGKIKDGPVNNVQGVEQLVETPSPAPSPKPTVEPTPEPSPTPEIITITISAVGDVTLGNYP